jgi:hypothetical protein
MRPTVRQGAEDECIEVVLLDAGPGYVRAVLTGLGSGTFTPQYWASVDQHPDHHGLLCFALNVAGHRRLHGHHGDLVQDEVRHDGQQAEGAEHLELHWLLPDRPAGPPQDQPDQGAWQQTC